jgi:SAM-dependent methyltransferase
VSRIDLDYPRRYCTICHQVVPRGFLPGPGGRPDASCPRCRSLERHRFFALLLSAVEPLVTGLDTLLEIAPSPETSPLLAGLQPRRHLRLDLGADNRMVDVLGSLTEIPLRTASVDLLVCYHVLEHVPDDRQAMREMARVLTPSGLGLLQVPFRPGTTTDEDPSAPVEERVRRFGQADHVRYYGDDFEDRLVESGLSLLRITPRSMLGPQMSTWLHLNPEELVWVVRRADGAAVPPPLLPSDTTLTLTLEAMLDELTTMRGRLVRRREEVRRLRVEVADLRAAASSSSAGRRVRARVASVVRRAAAAARRR